MSIRKLAKTWERNARKDAAYHILKDEGKARGGWDPDEFFDTGECLIRQLVDEYLPTIAPELSFGKALDFGCGLGRNTLPLAKRYERVVGVDISPTMIEKAKDFSKAYENIEYVVNEASNLSRFTDRSFDFVFSCIVLQHMRPRFFLGYIREFCRVLKPGGVCVFQLPEKNPHAPLSLFVVKEIKKLFSGSKGAKRVFRSIRDALSPSIEMHGMNRDVIEDLIQAGGCRPLDIVSDGGAGEGLTSWRYCIIKE